jgi:hypothetical protein
MQVLGAVTALFFFLCALLSWGHPTGGPVVGGGFLVFAGLGLVLIFMSITVEMTGECVRVSTPTQRQQMLWSEIQRVEATPDGSTLTFWASDGRKLSLTGPASWSGTDKADMERLLNAQLRARSIPLAHTSPWTLGRNTSPQ